MAAETKEVAAAAAEDREDGARAGVGVPAGAGAQDPGDKHDGDNHRRLAGQAPAGGWVPLTTFAGRNAGAVDEKKIKALSLLQMATPPPPT